MAGTDGSSFESILVIVGIIAVFLVFLLTLVVPFHEIMMPVLLGVAGLILLCFYLGNYHYVNTPGTGSSGGRPAGIKRDKNGILKKEPETPECPPGPGVPSSSASVSRAGLGLFVLVFIGFFYYEIFRRLVLGDPIPRSALIIQAGLVLLIYPVYRGFRYLDPAPHRENGDPGGMTIFLKWLAGFLFANFTRYITAGVLLNGSIALVIWLANRKTIDLDLVHEHGFILFLIFAFGNLLIFALVLLHLDKVGSQPLADDGSIMPVLPGTPAKYLNPKLGTVIMGILMFGFLAAFFAVPMLALGFGYVGPETHEREIIVTVERPDTTTIMVTYEGGRDAGMLVELSAYESVKPEWSLFRKRQREKTLTSSSIGSETSKIPLPIGSYVTLNASCPGKCRLEIFGRFSDGKYQKFYDAPL